MTRRFYKQVHAVAEEGGFAIRLDERVLPSMARRRLLLPNRDLAEAIAQEWRAQGDRIDPLTMPLTRLANTGVDQVGGQRRRYVTEMVRLAQTDALVYWAEEPRELVQRQEAEWRPLLDWFAEETGHALVVTTGIAAVSQPAGMVEVLDGRLEQRSDLALAGLHALASVAGSTLVAMAVDSGRLSPEQAFQVAHLEETYQAEVWGTDPEAEERRQSIARDMVTTAGFLALLHGG